jgi:hypothetical protein
VLLEHGSQLSKDATVGWDARGKKLKMTRNSEMRNTDFSILSASLGGKLAAIIVGWFMAASVCLSAQSPSADYTGNSAVWNSVVVESQTTIDAKPYADTGMDICQAINAVLGTSRAKNAVSVVVDARGVSPGNCSMNPWGSTASAQLPSATVLLPAGTITVSSTAAPLVLPQFTRLVGQGSGTTTVKASGLSAGSAMIQMGKGQFWCGSTVATFYDCQGIAVAHLTLDGGSLNVNGIVNNYAEELSYVDDVAFNNFLGTGLVIGVTTDGDANNSGPYSNIYCSNSTICASITGTTATRGIHGLTATTASSTKAAVYVDAPNNTIEDVFVSGYTDGIFVGSNGPASNNVLSNISGSATNVVHVSLNATNTGSTCPLGGQTGNPRYVCDLTMFAIAGSGSGNTILDDLSPTTLPKTTDATIGMYLLGERVIGSGISYSRFTTSDTPNATTSPNANVANWSFGTSAPPTGSSCATGSLYSCTGASGGSCVVGTVTHTLWGCVSQVWTPITSF